MPAPAKPKTKAPNPPAPLPAPDARVKKRMDAAWATQRDRAPTVEVSLKQVDGRPLEVSPAHADGTGWAVQLREGFGTGSGPFAASQLNQVIQAVRKSGVPTDQATVNGVLAVIDGGRPRDEVEAMLLAQMAVGHRLAMEALGRTGRGETIPQMEANGNLAVKLMRTYAAQVEALTRLKRGGEQKVTVEHVHVHAGGQAIVGNLRPGATGGRGSEDQ